MNPFMIAPMIGGAANIIGGLWGHSKNKNKYNPANAAMTQLNKIPGQVNPYYQPYINAGQAAQQKLTGQYGSLIDNPGQKFAELGAGYKESPGYQAKLREALAGANNAAALGGAGGLGSYGHEQLASQAAGDVANQDFEQYINHILGMYGKGLGGEEDINKMGFGASTGYGDILGNIGGQKANYAAAGQDWKNQNNQQNWGNIFSGAGQAGSGYFMGPEIQRMLELYMKGGR
jgi:hypothetical protein